MAHEPKHKHSKARKRTRRASILLKSSHILTCKNCGAATLPHIICKQCGFYGGKEVKGAKPKAVVTRA